MMDTRAAVGLFITVMYVDPIAVERTLADLRHATYTGRDGDARVEGSVPPQSVFRQATYPDVPRAEETEAVTLFLKRCSSTAEGERGSHVPWLSCP